MQIAVTGAYGFSGKYIAWRLLDLKHDVITLTNLSQRGNPVRRIRQSVSL
jgi:nucleoside-diphosphate-sugar epimerase